MRCAFHHIQSAVVTYVLLIMGVRVAMVSKQVFVLQFKSIFCVDVNSFLPLTFCRLNQLQNA